MARVAVYPRIHVERKMENKEFYIRYLMTKAPKYVSLRWKQKLLVDVLSDNINGTFGQAQDIFRVVGANHGLFSRRMIEIRSPQYHLYPGTTSIPGRNRAHAMPMCHNAHNSYTCPTVLVPFADVRNMSTASASHEYVVELLKLLDAEVKEASWAVEPAYYIKGCNTTRTRVQKIVASHIPVEKGKARDHATVADEMIKFMTEYSMPSSVSTTTITIIQ